MNEPFLSVAILAYDEEETVETTVRRSIAALEATGRTHEILLIDDGSRDHTAEIMERLAREHPVCRVLRHGRNLGIGPGMRTCFFASRGEFATFFPADMQADPAELVRLVPLLDHCDVLLTYRDPRSRRVSPVRKSISAVDRTLVHALFGVRARDVHWVRFFRRSTLDRMVLRAKSPIIDVEMLVAAHQMGARIHEAPFFDRPREHGVAKGATLRNVANSMRELVELRVRGVEVDDHPAQRTRPPV